MEGFELGRLPLYRGFSLGTQRQLEFRRLGASYSPVESGVVAYAAGHVYLAEKLVSVAVDHDRVFLSMELDRVTGASDFALNPQASLTDLARADILLLIKCILQRIAIRPAFKDLVMRLCGRTVDEFECPGIVRCMVDPIIAAGRMKDLLDVGGVYGFK